MFADGADPDVAAETRATAAYVLGVILRLLHPAMPFVTEELWDRFGYDGAWSLIREPWPSVVAVPDAGAAREELDWVVRLIGLVRSVRTEMNVPPSALAPVLLRDASPETLARAEQWIEAIRRMARASEVQRAGRCECRAESAQAVLDEATVVLPLAGLIDVAAERKRLAAGRGKALRRGGEGGAETRQRRFRIARETGGRRGEPRAARCLSGRGGTVGGGTGADRMKRGRSALPPARNGEHGRFTPVMPRLFRGTRAAPFWISDPRTCWGLTPSE